MLELSNVSASYGSVPAITGVTISIGEGEAVGLLGANGAGKSTTLRAISGLVKLSAGNVTFAGTDLASLPPHRIPELGIAHVPEGRQVFPEMTVQENLEIGAFVPKAKIERAQTMIATTSAPLLLATSAVARSATPSGEPPAWFAVKFSSQRCCHPGVAMPENNCGSIGALARTSTEDGVRWKT